MKNIKITLILSIAFFMLIFTSNAERNIISAGMDAKGYVAIVIDDFGNNSDGSKEMINLKIPFTGAVMPGLTHSAADGDALHKNGKEVILHMPMEAHSGKISWLGPIALTTDMATDEIARVLRESAENVPHIVGINNHMGSKATEDVRIMTEVLRICKEKGLFFLDSKTSAKSNAKEIAPGFGVTVLERDVFLDGTKDVAEIEKNLQKTSDLALKNGWAVAIGHVGQEGGTATAKAIQNKYEELQDKGIIFVTISELKEIINEG